MDCERYFHFHRSDITTRSEIESRGEEPEATFEDIPSSSGTIILFD